MSRNGTTGALWHWPDGLFMLIPVGITWLVWLVLFIEHATNLAHSHDAAIRFQALFCRIILIFPLIATLSYVSAAFPWSANWVAFVSAILEAYCLNAFFALLSGLGHIFFSKERFKLEIAKSRWTKGLFVRCGPEFVDGDAAYRAFRVMTYQVFIVKPLCALVLAIILGVTQGQTKLLARYILGPIAAISMIIAVIAILRIYRFLSDAPGSPLLGHNVLIKFVVVKAMFFFIILNQILIEPLINNSVIPIQEWICPPDTYLEEHAKEYCKLRLSSVIFICEVAILTIPAFFSYRHHGLRKQEALGENHYFHLRTFMYYCFLGLLDLSEFINGDVVNSSLRDSANEEERDSLLAETIMVT